MSLSTRLLIALLLGGGLFFGGYFMGKSDQRTDDRSEKLTAVEHAIKQANDVALQDAEILAVSDKQREQRRVIAKALDKEIEKNVAANPGYFECGLDADGLRNWNNGNAGDGAALSGRPGYGLPSTPLGKIGRFGGAGAQPQGSDRPVPRMQGAAQADTPAGEAQ